VRVPLVDERSAVQSGPAPGGAVLGCHDRPTAGRSEVGGPADWPSASCHRDQPCRPAWRAPITTESLFGRRKKKESFASPWPLPPPRFRCPPAARGCGDARRGACDRGLGQPQSGMEVSRDTGHGGRVAVALVVPGPWSVTTVCRRRRVPVLATVVRNFPACRLITGTCLPGPRRRRSAGNAETLRCVPPRGVASALVPRRRKLPRLRGAASEARPRPRRPWD